MGYTQPSQQFDGYFALKTLRQVEFRIFFTNFHLLRVLGGCARTHQQLTFFCGMTNNNKTEVDVETEMITWEIHVLGRIYAPHVGSHEITRNRESEDDYGEQALGPLQSYSFTFK